MLIFRLYAALLKSSPTTNVGTKMHALRLHSGFSALPKAKISILKSETYLFIILYALAYAKKGLLLIDLRLMSVNCNAYSATGEKEKHSFAAYWMRSTSSTTNQISRLWPKTY